MQQIWDDLPQTTINKATCINDFRKRLNECVSAAGEHFDFWAYYVNYRA